MKLDKPKIAMLALLALAVVGLAVDRLFLTSPATAPQPASASISGPAASLPPSSATPVVVPAVPAGADGIVERLRLAGKGLSLAPAALKDAFVPAESWLVKPNPAVTPTAVTTAVPVVDSGGRFISEHKLTSVLIDAGGGIAVVNDKVLRVGQEIDGYRLVRLAPGVAEFTGGPDGPPVRLQTVSPAP
jgi:hypothetical protein